VKVTAETITDEQILQLQEDTAELTGKHNSATVIALARPAGRDRRAQHKRESDALRMRCARETCAAMWNARHGAKP
jgi:hypothetical protein